MKNFILDLHRGDYHVFDSHYSPNSRQAKTLDQVHRLEEAIKGILDEKHHPLLSEYSEAYMNFVDACCDDEYLEGYRLGVRFMMAAWPEGKI